MWCLIYWLLELECTVSAFECLERCFPVKCNTIYSMGWLHLASYICLVITCIMTHAEHRRDEIFNNNWRKKNEQYDAVVVDFPKVIAREPETEFLLEMWEGMFKENYDRGQKQTLFLYTCGVIAFINLILFGLAAAVWLRNWKGGAPKYKNDWPWLKGHLGFGYAGFILLLTLILFVVSAMELGEVLDTERIYETYFPYCMRDTYFVRRFCIKSHQEIASTNDLCNDVTAALSTSYLCHNYYLKFRARMAAILAVVLHVIMVIGHAQLAYRPWGWRRKRIKLEEDATMKEIMQRIHAKLSKKAKVKLEIAKERKKIKMVDRKRKQEALKKERERLEMEIKIKNAKRRLHRRAERKEKEEQKGKMVPSNEAIA